VTAINPHTLLFGLYATLACGFAIAVALSSNVVRMALYLVLSLAATSGLFFLAGADFVGAMQLMIYVGGTLVLLIFGVMLTAQQRFVSMRSSQRELVLAGLMGAALVTLLVTSVWRVPAWRADPAPAVSSDTPLGAIEPLAFALLGMRIDAVQDSPEGGATGPLAGYLLPFEVVSIHLLVVLIGAGYLARTRVAAGSVTSKTVAKHLDDALAPKSGGAP
jgi:NADH-quinone oxidoreductase subunit J